MIDPTDPAFPAIDPYTQAAGMSIRTWLAGMAAQGLLSQHTSIEYLDGKHDVEPAYKFAEIPALALRQADMLIAELNKQTSTER